MADNAFSGGREVAEKAFSCIKFNLRQKARGGKRVFRRKASGETRVSMRKFKYPWEGAFRKTRFPAEDK